MKIRPFEIQVSQEAIDYLNQKLDSTRWASPLHPLNWVRGTESEYLSSLVTYWRKEFDWYTHQKKLNQFSHYQVSIDGMVIHFLREPGKGKNPIPLILTHGWPDSFYRYIKIISLLTDPARHGGNPEICFDVIIPSLPGFGFSKTREHESCNNSTVADCWVKLMTDALGYKKFAAAGGDIGSGVTRYMALNHPDSLIGIHLTDIGIIRDLLLPGNSTLTPEELKYKTTARKWMAQEGGYLSIQSTKPSTLAYALADSPVGLAAWILEKFRSWSDCKGTIENRFTKDELLTNIMIYWITNTIGSSVQMYYENTHSLPPMGTIHVPTGLTLFPADILLPPKTWAENHLNIIHWKEMPRGGHFTALEEPEIYAEDIITFFRKCIQLSHNPPL